MLVRFGEFLFSLIFAVARRSCEALRRTAVVFVSARQQVHLFELYRLDLDSHPHGLGEEFLDIGGGPGIASVTVEADRTDIETAEPRPAGRTGEGAFLSARHDGHFILIVETGNSRNYIAVETAGRRPGMDRSLPTAMALAKRIEFVEGSGPSSFIHEQLHGDKPGIIRLNHLCHGNP
jgi:hypothetical protein